MALDDVHATLRELRTIAPEVKAAIVVTEHRLLADPPTLVVDDVVVGAMVESWLGLGSKMVSSFLGAGLVQGTLTCAAGSLRLLPVREHIGLMLVMEGTAEIRAEVLQLVRKLADQV